MDELGQQGSQHGANVGIPRCVCSWKSCRTFQKGFREAKHPIFDGVIKLKLLRGHPASQELKESIDRVLRVPVEVAEDWKPGKKEGHDVIRYAVARHHFTEKHIRKYLEDPKGFSFLKPFSAHGAKKYLFTVDPNETFHLPNADASSEPLYLQCPNVPKEVVKAAFLRLREQHQMSQQPPQEPQLPFSVPSPTAMRPTPVAVPNQTIAVASGTNGQPSPKLRSDKLHHIGEKKDSLTVSTTPSSSDPQHSVQLKYKEEENKKLKDELEMMKSQLSFLHDMVRKLQEEHFNGGSAMGGGGDHMSVRSGRSYRSRSHSNRQQRGSGRSNRSGVPKEICMGEENWNERGDDWTEYQDDQNADPPNYEVEDDEVTTATFQSKYKPRPFSDGDDNTVATTGARSIVSASQSVKTLPRELEIDADEEGSDDHESLEEEAFDNRSFASTAYSRSAHSRSGHGARTPFETANEPHAMSASGPQRAIDRPKRRGSNGEQSQRSSRSTRSVTSSAAGVYNVTAMDVTDPYGEKGTYTGTISNSTGMPHGYGRLEYDRAGRWYEGDWKHGRWTGNGRLSNGDGDYYEGGLKNDHKHGHGIMRFADGRTFEGEYINGQMIEGRMTYQDGSTYTGSWVDGMRHGRGKCVFTDNSIYEGEFREGEFSGWGKMAWSDGGWYEGEWWNGDMHGRGKEVRPDGSIRHDGEWLKGQPNRRAAAH